MTKTEKRGLTLVLLVALVVGLVFVWRTVETKKAAQDAVLVQAFAGKVAGEKAQEAPVGDAPEDPALEATPTPAPELEAETEDGASIANDAVTAALADLSQTPPELEAPEQLPLVDAAALPKLEASTATLAELVTWMQTESLAATTAQANFEQAEAIALTEKDDAARRAFAATQGEANLQAEKNTLEQIVSQLAYQVLVAQSAELAVQEHIGYLTALQGELNIRLGVLSDVEYGKKLCIQVDLDACAQRLAELHDALEQATLARTDAVAALNIALGKAPTDTMVLQDVLTPVVYLPQDVETLVATALETRNEIVGAAYDITKQAQMLDSLRREFAPDNPQVIAQTSQVAVSEGAYLTGRNEVEVQVRTLAGQLTTGIAGLATKEAALQVHETALEKLTYVVVGGDTLFESNFAAFEQAYTGVETARNDWAQSVATFNQTVNALSYATGVGLVSIGI